MKNNMTEKKNYQVPESTVVTIGPASPLLTVSGEGDYEIRYGGDGDGEYGM